MMLAFTVAGAPHTVAVPDVAELPEAVEQIHAFVIAACGESAPHKHLQSRIADGVLNALVEQTETALGEVLAVPNPDAGGEEE